MERINVLATLTAGSTWIDDVGIGEAPELARDVREARAAVARLIEDAEAMLSDLEMDMAASPASSFRMVNSANRVAALRASLATVEGR